MGFDFCRLLSIPSTKFYGQIMGKKARVWQIKKEKRNPTEKSSLLSAKSFVLIRFSALEIIITFVSCSETSGKRSKNEFLDLFSIRLWF